MLIFIFMMTTDYLYDMVIYRETIWENYIIGFYHHDNWKWFNNEWLMCFLFEQQVVLWAHLHSLLASLTFACEVDQDHIFVATIHQISDATFLIVTWNLIVKHETLFSHFLLHFGAFFETLTKCGSFASVTNSTNIRLRWMP